MVCAVFHSSKVVWNHVQGKVGFGLELFMAGFRNTKQGLRQLWFWTEDVKVKARRKILFCCSGLFFLFDDSKNASGKVGGLLRMNE